MILRGLQIKHWRSIAELNLADLSAGIVVLHGPNRTGKSSLFKAICAGLFLDHSAKREEITESVPWGTTLAPSVTIDFQVAGADYRITKVFCSRKEGMAKLEMKIGEKWQLLKEAQKEASKKVRELLCCDKADQGVNQLLWLNQGDVELPKKLDQSLESNLHEVLGVLVTAHDHEFFTLLQEEYGNWFTPGTGDVKKNCRLDWLEKEEPKRAETVLTIEEDFGKVGDAIKEMESVQASIPSLRLSIKKAIDKEDELTKLQKDNETRLNQAKDSVEGERRLVEDYKQLNSLDQLVESVSNLIGQLNEKQLTLDQLNTNLTTIVAPDEASLRILPANYRKILDLRSQLEAAAWSLHLNAETDIPW